MDLLNDLNELIRDLSEDQYLATSESPASAEEKINHYESLLQSWRRMLYSQVGILRILHILESHDSYLTLVDEDLIEADAHKTLQFLTQEPNSDSSSNNPINRQALLLESEHLGEKTQKEWQELEAKRKALLNEANALLNKYSSRSSVLAKSPEENHISTEIREEREQVQQSLTVAQAELIETHNTQITQRMTRIDSEIPVLRELNNELKMYTARSEELEKILYEDFGILARDSDCGDNTDTWLQEEADFVASVLQSEVNALALIFTSEVTRNQDDWILTITPKKAWPARVLSGVPGAVFKGLTVQFSLDSMLPIDIKVKADLSSIPADKAAKAQADLAGLVDKWRTECYASPQLDIHHVIRVFIQHAWSLIRP